MINNDSLYLQNFEFAETVSATYVVGDVLATDQDRTSAITYSILSGDQTKFNLDSASGELTLIDGIEPDAPTNEDYR